MEKKILVLALALAATVAHCQVKLAPDTLQCHVIGFSVGLLQPGTGTATLMQGGNMKDLYEGPSLNFALGCDYKHATNWTVSLDGDLWFGLNSDNLSQRNARLGSIVSPTGDAISWGGQYGGVTAYNRGLAVRLGIGRTIPVFKNNPNSGPMLKLSAGWMMQKSVYSQNYHENPVPQLSGDYARLYDHLRHGAILTEGIGFSYMSNYLTYINVRVMFEVSQVWSFSTRSYQIDNLMGLNGKDNNRYFDLIYGIKLTWMFPLTGKTTYDYYYF